MDTQAIVSALRRPTDDRRRAPSEVVWHYTSGHHLKAILASGVLRLSRPRVLNGVTVEHSAVWFSRRRDWDPAAGLGWEGPERSVSAEEMGGVARIGVEPSTAPLTFADFVRMGGLIPAAVPIRLAEDRNRGSNPDDWRISLEPVPASKWLRVEWRSGVREGERWEPV